MKNGKATHSYARLHKRGLTLAQQNAVDLLASGRNDTEVAGLLNLNRVTVTKWRCYDVVFQAALNVKRAEVWGAAADRLRSLVPRALDTLADMLHEDADPPLRVKAAAEVLRLAQLPPASSGIGPTDPEAIVKQVVEERRTQTPDGLDALLQSTKGLPPLAEHTEQVWCELEALANGEGDADA
jgi:hypothetical protein